MARQCRAPTGQDPPGDRRAEGVVTPCRWPDCGGCGGGPCVATGAETPEPIHMVVLQKTACDLQFEDTLAEYYRIVHGALGIPAEYLGEIERLQSLTAPRPIFIPAVFRGVIRVGPVVSSPPGLDEIVHGRHTGTLRLTGFYSPGMGHSHAGGTVRQRRAGRRLRLQAARGQAPARGRSIRGALPPLR